MKLEMKKSESDMTQKHVFKNVNFSGLQNCRKARSIQYKIIDDMKFFKVTPLPIFLPYEYIHGHVSPAMMTSYPFLAKR